MKKIIKRWQVSLFTYIIYVVTVSFAGDHDARFSNIVGDKISVINAVECCVMKVQDQWFLVKKVYETFFFQT